METRHHLQKAFASVILMAFFLGLSTCKKSEKAPEIPSVTTKTPALVTETSATVGGFISSDGGAPVTERGVCYSTNQNPTVTDLTVIEGGGTGNYQCILTGLSSATTYNVRAYALNSAGIGYGSQATFTTSAISPTVTTDMVTNVNGTTAICGGNVTSQGSSPVTVRGVCWNTTGHPTLADCIAKTEDGSGTGTFSSTITGLNLGTTYYVTAYATNQTNTAYGSDIKQFETPSFACGISTVAYEGQNYETVQIGTQCWFRENLDVGERINGGINQTDNSLIEKYCYKDLLSNCDTYGGLYQWDELMQYVTTDGARGICPVGWHIPTDVEWVTLSDVLGGVSVAGGKMKEQGTGHWFSPNTGATNSSGFTALPGGLFTSGVFDNLTYYTFYWTSSEQNAVSAWYRALNYNTEGIFRDYVHAKNSGLSVRCLKD
jgi:uncharacterized protein (TIGR02145 family)